MLFSDLSSKLKNASCTVTLALLQIALRTIFSYLSGTVITIMAVERWLHMSGRSLLTVRRVIIVYITFAAYLILEMGGSMYVRYYRKGAFSIFAAVRLFLGGSLCVSVTAFAYFKVSQIIRHHQNQVQAINENAIDMQKYKKSIFTMKCILVIFVFSYVPCMCVQLVYQTFPNYSPAYYVVSVVCATIVLSSSFINLLLYYWRIKEIRDTVKTIAKKIALQTKWRGFVKKKKLCEHATLRTFNHE